MGDLSREAVEVAVTLLPGFLSVKVKDFFRPPRELPTSDMFLEVVAFSVANYVIASIVLSLFNSRVGVFPESLVNLGLSSLVLGMASGIVVGNDLHYRWARWFKLTTRTGRDDVWQDALGDISGNWMLIHLADSRRVMGWARYYSDNGKSSSVFLKDASWVEDDDSMIPIEGEGVLVTEASQIRYVEFLGQGVDE